MMRYIRSTIPRSTARNSAAIHSIAVSVLLAASAIGSAASADDTMSTTTPSTRQMMKDCIEKQKQKSSDIAMSKAQMRRLCKDELKAQKETGATAPPPVDAPKTP